jgi:hypothetical protein
LFDNKGDDQITAGRCDALIYADLRLSIAKLMQKRCDRLSVLFQKPSACQPVAVTKNWDKAENVRFL